MDKQTVERMRVSYETLRDTTDLICESALSKPDSECNSQDALNKVYARGLGVISNEYIDWLIDEVTTQGVSIEQLVDAQLSITNYLLIRAIEHVRDPQTRTQVLHNFLSQTVQKMQQAGIIDAQDMLNASDANRN